MSFLEHSSIEVFSTCPESADYSSEEYVRQVQNIASWSEEAGCRGILVYADNRLTDPWQVAQIIVENTQHLAPLVAVQPVYMHPYSVAKMVSSLGYMYRRKVYLNMVAGGFRNDLKALNDPTPHDLRYERLTEYTTIIMELLRGETVTFEGKFYKVENLSLQPELPEELLAEVFVSGSSDAGLNAAKTLAATAIKYPRPVGDYEVGEETGSDRTGIRVGIIARESDEEAWNVGVERFPPDRAGQFAHQLAMKTSDSQWHKQLSEMARQLKGRESPYWLHPFENYKTFCPYLVGSYERTAQEIRSYIQVGFQTFILDIPPGKEELKHINIVFDKALEMVSL